VVRRIHSNPSVPQSHRSPEDSALGDEGANYLGHSRSTVAEEGDAGDPSKTGRKGGGRPPSSANAINWKERRSSPRIRCSGSVEFCADGTGVRMWGTLTDISLHGCYVEMSNTYPVDTKANLVLKSFGIRIEVTGVVRTSYPFLGMGICFSKIDPDAQHHLTQLIDALAGHRRVLPLPPTEARSAIDPVSSVDPTTFLHEITEFFRSNQLLSREEFHRIAQRVRRLQPSHPNPSA
jgi:hypothetical protein